MSKVFVHIIAEEIGKSWQAWFAGTPQVAYGGEHPAEAIDRLLDSHGRAEFDIDQIETLDDLTTTTHQEFRLPLVHLNRIPKPSSN